MTGIYYVNVKMSVILSFLGYDLKYWRIPGVLQRFSLSYVVVGLVNLWFSPNEDVIDV